MEVGVNGDCGKHGTEGERIQSFGSKIRRNEAIWKPYASMGGYY
jgi:hypothetical protein